MNDIQSMTILSKKVSALAEKYGIVYAIVFGSAIDGRYIRGESDIDLAVKLRQIDKKNLYTFMENFLLDIGIENLDLVVVNFAPFSLALDILTRGKVIYCSDEDELFEDRLRAIKMYDDWLYFSRYFVERELRKVTR
jgi:predicted nucleotidyltransferase